MTVARSEPPLAFSDVEGIVTALRRRGGRVSATRRLVLEALFAADGPVSAERIAGGLGGATRRLDPASVYRNLERLEQLGAVRHVHMGHGPGLYALAAGGDREYLACERCGRVTSVDPAELDRVRALIRRSFGYEARFSHFPILGICERCAEASAPTEPRRPSGGDMSSEEHAHEHPHAHEHQHGDVVHEHPHTTHDHEHVEHEHEHSHGDRVHAHPHVHESGLEEEHEHGH
jgi:Fur family ferric uptake transcriptional regulator